MTTPAMSNSDRRRQIDAMRSGHGMETMKVWRDTIQDDALRAQVSALILEGQGRRTDAILAARIQMRSWPQVR